MNCFVKESHGFVWHFYHNSHGICYCKMKDEHVQEYQVLLPEGKEDFDVITDDSNCIHMVFQNDSGDILYATHFEDTWRKTVLMKSKNNKYYPKNFVIKKAGNFLNLLYCIKYNGNIMLTHQVINAKDCNPLVVDCIKNTFYTAQSPSGNITVLFYSETQKDWGIKNYDCLKNEWTDFMKLNIPVNCNDPFVFADKDEKIHILYEYDANIVKYSDGKEEIIGVGKKPVMFFNGNNIIAWEGIMDNKVYIKKQEDTSHTVIMPGVFSRPLRYKIRYTSYEPDIWGECCTGNIINGTVRLYGINNFFVVSAVPPAVVNKKTEELTELYREFQKLRIQVSQLNTLVEKLKIITEENDTKKLDRRLTELETAVNKSFRNKFLNLF